MEDLAAVKGKSSRPPRGGRGLKYNVVAADALEVGSPSSRRAWIEIMSTARVRPAPVVALLAEGVD